MFARASRRLIGLIGTLVGDYADDLFDFLPHGLAADALQQSDEGVLQALAKTWVWKVTPRFFELCRLSDVGSVTQAE